ncbi:MAG TPA: Gfo/Idh/MocA family oxidoreductase [Gaiellaceae bacterium]|nr:Gfo/Idh/MocA family oxidoreductase [Gaiellaceae bacterium]
MSRRLAVGLIGCGNIALNHHVPAYLELADRCYVAGVADPTPSRRELVAAQLGLGDETLFADGRELLERMDVDIVDVCTPQHLRKDVILEAIRRGRDVLSEKPLTAAPADAAELVDAAAAAGVRLGVVHNYGFFPEIAAAMQAIVAGDIGDPEVAIVNYLGVPDIPGTGDWRPDWRHDPAASGGGVLMDMLHAVYVAEGLLGSAFTGVSAFVFARTPGSVVEEVALCRYEAPSAAALVNVGWGHGPGGIQVSGTDGRLEVRYADGGTAPFVPLEGVWVHGPDGPREIEVGPSVDTVVAAITDFVDALIEGRPALTSGADGLHVLEAVVGAYASSASGQLVSLPLERESAIFERGLVGLGDAEPLKGAAAHGLASGAG